MGEPNEAEKKKPPEFKPLRYARAICEKHKLMFNPNDSMYLYRDRGYWHPIHSNYVEQLALESMEKLGTIPRSSKCADIRKMVELSCLIPPDRTFNELNGHVNVRNGMLDVSTRELKHHDPDHLSTVQLNLSYDPAATYARWEQFLEEVFEQDEERIDLAQEFMGYSMVPDCRFEKALLFIGEGANGKSTFIRVWEQIIGKENISSVTLAGLQNEFHRATLLGKLINITAEVNPMTVEQSDYFKRIISGDTIDAAHKNKPVFTFKPFARLVFAMNRMPRVKDTSYGFYRRLLLVPFNRIFEGGEADRELSKKLSGELDGIFNWALKGLDRLYQNDSFTEPKVTKDMLEEYKRANNPLVAFVQDCCEFHPVGEVGKDALYGEYRKYCDDYGYVALSHNTFFKELYSAFPDLKVVRPRDGTKRERIVEGIKMVKVVG